MAIDSLEAPQEDPVCISKGHFAEPGPDVARSQEREKQRLRSKARSASLLARSVRSRGPSGPPRSGESGKMGPLQSRRPVTYRCALLSVPLLYRMSENLLNPLHMRGVELEKARSRLKVQGWVLGVATRVEAGDQPSHRVW